MDSVRPLDFLVVGAQKSGTTTLHEYLRKHPRLVLPPNKEAPFFVDDSYDPLRWPSYFKDTFGDPDPSALIGKVTPQYMAGGLWQQSEQRPAAAAPGGGAPERIVPDRIHAVCPDARIIAILRDPVPRAVSHYRMQRLIQQEDRPIDAALLAALDPGALAEARSAPSNYNGYIVLGEYGRILSGYAECFGPEHVHVAFLNELERAPQAVLDGIYEFLGVDRFVPPNLGVTYRKGATEMRLPWLKPDRIQAAIAHNSAMRSLWHVLPLKVRRDVNRAFWAALYRFRLWNRRGGAEHEAGPAPDTVAALRRHFESDSIRLGELVGRPVPWQPAGLSGTTARP